MYLESLVNQLKLCTLDPMTDQMTGYQFNWILNILQSVQCKRLIFDARQAQVFDQSSEIDERRREKIRPPFGMFYMEMTQPLLLKAQEPGEQDRLRAFLFNTAVDYGTEVLDGGKTRRRVPVTKVTFFYKCKKDQQFIDRSWSLSPEGYPLVGRPPKHIAQRYKIAQGEGAQAEGLIDIESLPDYVQEGELISVFDLKKLGWWEECLVANTNLIYWIFAYTMAKSVEIVEVTPSRQIRRACEREGKPLPPPWHMVKVEPKRIKKGKDELVGESGIKHSYRYDVIGHLRFNKHRTKDGKIVETIEWVSDHIRGLENEVYIPKTYKVEKNKKIALPEMERYFKS